MKFLRKRPMSVRASIQFFVRILLLIAFMQDANAQTTSGQSQTTLCSNPWTDIDCAIEVATRDQEEITKQIIALSAAKYDACQADLLDGLFIFTDAYLSKLVRVQKRLQATEDYKKELVPAMDHLMSDLSENFVQEVDPVYPLKKAPDPVKVSTLILYAQVISKQLKDSVEDHMEHLVIDRATKNPMATQYMITLDQAKDIVQNKLNEYIKAKGDDRYGFSFMWSTPTVDGPQFYLTVLLPDQKEKIKLALQVKPDGSVSLQDNALNEALVKAAIEKEAPLNWMYDFQVAIHGRAAQCEHTKNPIIEAIKVLDNGEGYYNPIFQKNMGVINKSIALNKIDLKKNYAISQGSGGVEYVYIPAGKFAMRSRGGAEVTISRGFYMQMTEVSQKQWKEVYPETTFIDDNLPISSVSWKNVQEYISKLNKKLNPNLDCTTFLKSFVTQGCFRLPTSAEWEYAAQAGTTGVYYFGSDKYKVKNYAWLDENSENKKHGVSKCPHPNVDCRNPWGLYHMLGNVSEWVQDYHDRYDSNKHQETAVDPVELSPKSYCLLRGGGFQSVAVHLEVPYTSSEGLSYSHPSIGFRLVRTAAQ